MRQLKLQISVLAALSALASWVVGCTGSSEGGVVGSGITSVQGNIVEVQVVPDQPADQREGGAAAGAALPTVLVSIDESPGTEATTDAEGSFILEGTFAGTITVRFRALGGEETLGTLPVEIGAGATVVLPDITIRTDLPEDQRVLVRPPLQINLFGHVTVRECGTMRLEIEDESPARNHFVLRLHDDAEIVNADDTVAVSCDRIEIGDRVTVEEGIINRDEGLIETLKLRLQPTEPVPPATVRVRRSGTVVRTVCERGLVHFQDSVPNDLVSVRLGRADISCGTDAPRRCGCTDIHFGDLIEVVGTRSADAARPIDATRVHVTPNPAASFVTTAAGDVVSIDCTAGVFRALVNEVAGDAVRPQEIILDLTDTTEYRCFGDVPCSCADVRDRDRVAIEALVAVDQSTAPEALVITVLTAGLRLLGTIETADCGAGRLVVETEANPPIRVNLHLTRDTQFQLFDGTATTCRSLVAGARVGVRGHVERGEPGAPRRNVADLVRVERPQPR